MIVMGMIGSGRRVTQEKCAICDKTFPEDQLELTPYKKTKTVELMCKICRRMSKPAPEIPVKTSKPKDENVIITEKKTNKLKEIVNSQAEPLNKKSQCTCAKFPMCKAIRATQAWDEFSNMEVKAFFVGAGFDFYKISFCPFCGNKLYKIKEDNKT